MATTFFKKKFNNREVRLTSFFGGTARGRCLEIAVNPPGSFVSERVELTRVDVVELVTGIVNALKSKNSRINVKAGNVTLKLGRIQAATLKVGVYKWLMGDALREIP